MCGYGLPGFATSRSGPGALGARYRFSSGMRVGVIRAAARRLQREERVCQEGLRETVESPVCLAHALGPPDSGAPLMRSAFASAAGESARTIW
jgi:hypothetical protein